jgi:hypothetical protein
VLAQLPNVKVRTVIMDQQIVAGIILVLSSFVVMLIGYAIGYRKELSLIAGLDESKVRDRDGLARWVGRGLLGIGVLDVLVSLAMFVPSVGGALVVVTYVGVNLVGAAVLLSRVRRYLS